MRNPSNYERLTTVPLEDVVGMIGLPPHRPTITIMGQELKLYSLRLRTFAKTGTRCHGCGAYASFFAVERQVKGGTDKYHLNLYGLVDGREELFTCDHVHARSKGGANNLSNTQTMCITCNSNKADK
jgi:hypothetical protein